MIGNRGIDEVRALVRSRLSGKRYQHSLNVMERAVQLARRFGGDMDKAEYAGLTHDICKGLTNEEQLLLLRGAGIEPGREELCSPQLFHAMAAECYLRDELGVRDEDILSAVRYHTTGRVGMSLLEEIVYLADLTSADRDYPDAEKTRKIVDKSLTDGMAYALSYVVGKLVRDGKPVCEDSFRAYNHYILLSQGGTGA